MAYTFLSRFKVHPHKDADFVKLTSQGEAVAANESDTLAYTFYRLDEPHHFAVFESFTDEAADIAHQQNPEMAPVIKGMMECIDGGYEREMLHDVKKDD